MGTGNIELSNEKHEKEEPLCVGPPNSILTHQQDQSATKCNHVSEQDQLCQGKQYTPGNINFPIHKGNHLRHVNNICANDIIREYKLF